MTGREMPGPGSRTLVAGVDEAGRGPLAGPVFAAAVILDPDRLVAGLADSKRLSEAARERLDGELRRRALAFGLGLADAGEIDRINVREATFLAMRRALVALASRGAAPGLVRVDGNALPRPDGLGFECRWEAVVGGDASVAEISAASILAKCARDAWMREAARRFPGYGFEVHKGYGTAAHFQALAALGPCSLHRRSFAPLKSGPARR